MSKERLIVNEIIIVGEKRQGQDAPIPTTLTGEELAKAIKAKFKFVRDSVVSEAGKAKGFKSNRFFQLRMTDPGGEVATKGGKTFRLSRKTNTPAFDSLFENNMSVTFNEVKEELLANKFEPVGTPDEGIIRLTEFGIVGFWDEFPLGFDAYIWQRSKVTGKMEQLIAHPRNDDGSYRDEPAIQNSGRHFVYESEVENLESLRDTIRRNMEKYKVPTVKPNTDQKRTGDAVQEAAAASVTAPVTAPVNAPAAPPADDL